jgi:mannose-6-phosphate isomerase-like protein (cupin superfamily)
MLKKVNLKEKLAKFQDYWHPRIIGELNQQYVKLVKFQGEFVWHSHIQEDELFLVIKGKFRMELRDIAIELKKGDFIIIPHGIEHRPVAKQEVHVLLFEPQSTINTGGEKTEYTHTTVDWV